MTLRRLAVLGLVVVSLGGRPAQGALTGGVEVHPYNFFILPSNTGLETKGNFGLGSLFVGFAAGSMISLRAYLTHDQSGTFRGDGTLYGTTGSFEGKFKLLSYGAEVMFSPPMMPLYFKAGVGLADLNSDVSFNVAGTPLADPFDNFDASFELHGGLGFTLSLMALQLYAGLEAVYVKFDKSTIPGTANSDGFVFFRTILGAALVL